MSAPKKITGYPHIMLSTKRKDIDMPSPTQEDLNSELFNKLWELMKNWDINVPDYYTRYKGCNGSHLKLIIDAIKPTIRNQKIEDIIT